MTKKILSVFISLLIVTSIATMTITTTSAASPSFKGGTIYFQLPDTWAKATTFSYAHVYGHNSTSLYEWQTKGEWMKHEGNGLFSYYIPAGPYDLIVFSTYLDSSMSPSKCVQTYSLVLSDANIGMTAVSDTDTILEDPMYYNKDSVKTTWQETGKGAHLAITSSGNVNGDTLCPTENGTDMVAQYIKDYLPVQPEYVTADVLKDAMSKAGTTADKVIEVLKRDSQFTMLTEAESLLGYSHYEYAEKNDGTLEITSYININSESVLPYEINGKTVTTIGDWAFYDCTNLTSVSIPNSVTSIGKWAFYGCTRLTHVTIPPSVTSIGAWAFEGCTDLTISGYAGSAAEQYAIDNGFEFIALEPEKVLGDVTADGKITVADAIMIQKHIANIITLEGDSFTAADVDKNEKITVADAIMVQKHIANIISIA